MIINKTITLEKTIAKIDKYWDDHPQWKTNTHESKIVYNLLRQLERKSNNFMDCFPRIVLQGERVDKHKLTLVLAAINLNFNNINKILRLVEAIVQINEIVKPIRIMLTWNNILKRLETY